MSTRTVTPSRAVDPAEASSVLPAERVSPAADIYETAEHIELVLDVPGLSDKDLRVTVEDEILEIQGAVEPVAFGGLEENFREFPRREYFRRFQLPTEADTTKIDARLRHGVLTLTLGKKEQAKPRQIPIRV